MPYTWRRAYDGSESLTPDAFEWDEVWNVYGYSHGPAALATPALLADRPDLAIGKPHGTVPNAYVDAFEPSRIGTSRMVQVRVRYKTEPNKQLDVSPLDRPAEISVESETIEVPTFRRLDGSLILNTAGDLIHGLTRRVNRRIFNFEKNVAAIPSWLFDYSDNAVNSDTVTIEWQPYNPGYLMLTKVRGTPYTSEQVNGVAIAFRTLTFSLVYDPRGWDEKVYNRGLRERRLVSSLDSSSGVTSLPAGSGSSLSEASSGGETTTARLVWIVDEDEDGNRTPTEEPQFLDADGRRLTPPIDPANVIEIDGVGVNSLPFGSVLPLA